MQTRKLARTPFVALALILTIAGILIAPRVHAKLAANTVDTVATIADNGRRIIVTGPCSCDQTQPVFMRVTVTQRTTGAVAEGKVHFIGTIAPQQWQVIAHTIGNATFEPGPATAVALAQSIGSPGQADDAQQWLVNVTLVIE